MRLPQEPERPFSINLVPMIDAIFAILAFVLIASLFLTRSEGLPVNLPNAVTGQIQAESQATVSIAADGSIQLNQQPVTLEQLTGAVQQLVVPGSEALVLVNADEQVPHGRVVVVMDRLRTIAGVKLAIAVEQPTTP
ncbi:MAG: biopolymer transporter ExbD [Spirulinaceae cyanobacterium RM2_2_10]|nr:biopolymer transporter ExbD [Spirulinaceae cyanobacterium SM2_1_0]NJO19645.1 biopolymer transporter ExbD [Spirulinaceae cyanobacterium RM2_2_10]